MSLHLDFPTLMIASVLVGIGIALGFTLILLLLPRQRVPQLWTASLWLFALALLIISAQPARTSVMLILSAHACLEMANALLLYGLATHTGARKHQCWLACGMGLYMLGIIWFAAVRPDLAWRTRMFCLASIGTDAWAIAMLLCCHQLDIRRSCRLAAGAFAFHALLYVVQFARIPFHVSPTEAARDGCLPISSFYVIMLLLILARCFAMLLLIIERLMVGLRCMARLDGLTGLLNRNAILADGSLSLQQARRAQLPLTVLLCDLDHFKNINDTWGHLAGDKVLVQVAGLIGEATAARAHLASRYGGEEFLLVLADCDVDQAQVFAEALRDRIQRSPVVWEGEAIQVTTSIGLCVDDTVSRLERLIGRADKALYCSKREGRNRVTLAAEP